MYMLNANNINFKFTYHCQNKKKLIFFTTSLYIESFGIHIFFNSQSICHTCEFARFLIEKLSAEGLLLIEINEANFFI